MSAGSAASSGPAACRRCGEIGRWTSSFDGPGLTNLHMECTTNDCSVNYYVSP